MRARRAPQNHIGKQLAAAESGGFSYAHWIARANGDHVEPHGHANAHFMFILTGAFETEAGGEVDGPALIFNPAQTFHRDHFQTAGAFFSVSIPQPIDQELNEWRLPSAPSRINAATAHATLWRLMRRCHDTREDTALGAESLCLELLGSASERQHERRAPPWLTTACELLREEQPTTVAAIAQRVGVHPIHLARSFRRFLNSTPGEYQRAFRAHRAAAMLLNGRRTPAEIATECGYADQAHFTRSFSRAYGLTPGAYRRMTV